MSCVPSASQSNLYCIFIPCGCVVLVQNVPICPISRLVGPCGGFGGFGGIGSVSKT